MEESTIANATRSASSTCLPSNHPTKIVFQACFGALRHQFSNFSYRYLNVHRNVVGG